MKPQQKLILLFAGFLFLNTGLAFGQKKIYAHAHKSIPADSIKWLKDNYIVNRDSAFANPYFALQKLKGGNRRFTENRSIHPRQNPALIKKLSAGQAPFATIVGCSDSRVSAEILFDQGFGDLFIVRTAGQVMAEASYGTLEYGYLALKTKLIVVLGHTNCGAVDAAIKRPENPPGHIVTLINAIKPAAIEAKKLPGNVLDNAIRINVINQVNHLRHLEPVLSKNYEEGKLLIIGAVYDLGSGKVEFLKETLDNLPPTAFAKHDITGK
jgi:carbonic anhydrase